MTDRRPALILEAWLKTQPACLDDDAWTLLHDGEVHSWLIGEALKAIARAEAGGAA